MPNLFGSYNKLAYAIIGNLVAMLMVWLATKGFATCVPGPTNALDQICTVAGFTTAQITGAVLTLINSVAVYAAPKNNPPA